MKTHKNILIAFLLNLLFSIIEFIGGILTNSVAIISDSIHDIGDAMSIGLSYFLERKSVKKPDNNYTYGYARYSILGSIITTFILLGGSILVIYNAMLRLFSPIDINYNGMILFAVLGTIINLLAAYFTKDGESLNQKSVNLHMLEDVFGWIIVLIGSIIMRFTDIKIIDSLLSIVVAIFIFIHALRNLKEVLDIFLEKTPIDIEKLKKSLLSLDNILDVHHIHVRSLDGIHNYATMHVVTDGDYKTVKLKVKEELRKQMISHTTIEFEDKDEICASEKCETETLSYIGHHHQYGINMKKKLIIIFLTIFLILIIPIPLQYFDGGSVEYKAILYSITKIHRINHDSATGYEDGWKIEIFGIKIYNKTNISSTKIDKKIIIETIRVASKTYHKMSDGTYEMNGIFYKYKLEITGRMPFAEKDSTLVYLSNIKEISFEKAYMAAGLSSNMEDYYDKEDAVFIEWR